MELAFLYSNQCVYCQEVSPRVDTFVAKHQATCHKVEVPVLDEDGIPHVPGLICDHPSVRGLLLVGRSCLDMLQHHLGLPHEEWV